MMSLNGTLVLALTASFIRARARSSSPASSAPNARRSRGVGDVVVDRGLEDGADILRMLGSAVSGQAVMHSMHCVQFSAM